MSKRTVGIFFFVSIIMGLVGAGLIIGGLVGSTYTTTTVGSSTHVQLTSIGNEPLFVLGIVIAALAGIPYLVAWIGALVNLARLQQWVWFILVFIFHFIALLVYVIAGPTTPPGVPQYAQYAPPQGYPPPQGYAQPPQGYPQPPQGYSQPPQGYSQPPQGYSQRPQNYPQQPQDHPQQPQDHPQQ